MAELSSFWSQMRTLLRQTQNQVTLSASFLVLSYLTSSVWRCRADTNLLVRLMFTVLWTERWGCGFLDDFRVVLRIADEMAGLVVSGSYMEGYHVCLA
jgi:hypothetical protein